MKEAAHKYFNFISILQNEMIPKKPKLLLNFVIKRYNDIVFDNSIYQIHFELLSRSNR